MGRALAAAGILVLLCSTAAGLSARPLAAQLSWHEAHAVGTVGLDGPAWALQLPITPSEPIPQAALFLLEAAEIQIDGAYHDYVGSSQGMVQKDTNVQHERETLKESGLTLAAIGAEAGFLLERGQGPGPNLHLQATSVQAMAEAATRLDLFPSFPGAPPHDLQRSTDLPATALRAAADGLKEAFVVRGDFRIHLWDIDLQDPATDRTYYSGTDAKGRYAESQLTPTGAAYEARSEVLELVVRDGRLSIAMPGRVLEAHFQPDEAVATSEGSWDVASARGDLLYDGESHAVDGSDVHMEGSFNARFGAEADGAIQSRWSGSAETAGAARATFAPELAKAPAPKAPVGHNLWWLFAVGGIVVVGAGTGGVFALRRHRATPILPVPAGPGGAVPETELASDEEALMTRCIGLLQAGKADEVVQALEPGYDAEEPVAAVKAYLLSLAHLKRGENEAGLQWFLRAIQLYPDFGQEVQANDAFTPIRSDPRLRRFTDEGATGYA